VHVNHLIMLTEMLSVNAESDTNLMMIVFTLQTADYC
jgi:hypothetical protein